MSHAFTAGPWPGAVPGEFHREMRRAVRRLRRAVGPLLATASCHGGPPGGHRAGPADGPPHEHRHRAARPGPWWGFGPGGPWGGFAGFGGGRRPPFGRGRKAKRGDVRAAILALLAEEPRNGYQIIQEITERSQGGWTPSPGAVYPALQQLTDEGLVQSEETDGRRTFRLTEAGRAYVAAHPEEVRAPWEEMRPEVDAGVSELFDLSRQAAHALFQIACTGDEAQLKAAKQVVAETRRRLYRILAGDDPAAPAAE